MSDHAAYRQVQPFTVLRLTLPIAWPRRSIALDEIERIELTRARAIHGAGIRGLGRKRLFNVTMGGCALALALRDGRTILLGTPEPQRLRGTSGAGSMTPS